jgi:hypothetical protein
MQFTEMFSRLATVLFGTDPADPANDIDPALLDDVVDAIVEAVEPRLRLVPRYRNRLAPSATRSIRFLRSLAPRLPAPIELSRAAWGGDPYVNAFFATSADIQTLLDRSVELRAFFDDPANIRCDAAFGVLGMRREERNVLAPALVEGEVRGDVAQTTVGFTAHTLLATSAEPLNTRGLLGQAILKRVAGLALERIVAMRDRATELSTRRSIMAARLRMLTLRRDGLRQLSAGEQDPSVEIATIERELKATAEDHLEIRASLATLDHGFEQIEAVLGDPERYLGLDTIELRVSHTGYKLDPGTTQPGSELCLNELWIGPNLRAVIVPVHIPRSALSSQQDRRAELTRQRR